MKGKDSEISRQVIHYWTNFAKFGTPNSVNTKFIHWTDFSSKNQTVLIIDETLQYGQFKNQKCDAIDKTYFTIISIF